MEENIKTVIKNSDDNDIGEDIFITKKQLNELIEDLEKKAKDNNLDEKMIDFIKKHCFSEEVRNSDAINVHRKLSANIVFQSLHPFEQLDIRRDALKKYYKGPNIKSTKEILRFLIKDESLAILTKFQEKDLEIFFQNVKKFDLGNYWIMSFISFKKLNEIANNPQNIETKIEYLNFLIQNTENILAEEFTSPKALKNQLKKIESPNFLNDKNLNDFKNAENKISFFRKLLAPKKQKTILNKNQKCNKPTLQK